MPYKKLMAIKEMLQLNGKQDLTNTNVLSDHLTFKAISTFEKLTCFPFLSLVSFSFYLCLIL